MSKHVGAWVHYYFRETNEPTFLATQKLVYGPYAALITAYDADTDTANLTVWHPDDQRPKVVKCKRWDGTPIPEKPRGPFDFGGGFEVKSDKPVEWWEWRE